MQVNYRESAEIHPAVRQVISGEEEARLNLSSLIPPAAQISDWW